jgi:hypothetical protein
MFNGSRGITVVLGGQLLHLACLRPSRFKTAHAAFVTVQYDCGTVHNQPEMFISRLRFLLRHATWQVEITSTDGPETGKRRAVGVKNCTPSRPIQRFPKHQFKYSVSSAHIRSCHVFTDLERNVFHKKW